MKITIARKPNRKMKVLTSIKGCKKFCSLSHFFNEQICAQKLTLVLNPLHCIRSLLYLFCVFQYIFKFIFSLELEYNSQPCLWGEYSHNICYGYIDIINYYLVSHLSTNSKIRYEDPTFIMKHTFKTKFFLSCPLSPCITQAL